MYRKIIAPIIACLLLALLGWLLFQVMKPFLVAIGWALALTVVTFPIFKRVRCLLGERSNTAAVLMLFAVILIMVVPTVVLVVSLSRQAAEFYLYIENIIAHGNQLQAIKERLGAYYEKPFVGSAAVWLVDHISSLNRTDGAFPEDLKAILGSVTKMLSSIVSNAFNFFLNLGLTMFALFVFYTRGELMFEKLVSIAPLPASRAQELTLRYCSVIRAVFKNVVLTALAQGILGGIGFWVTGLPSPLLFGSLMAVSTLVPYVGTALVWLPGGLYLIIIGKTWLGICLIIWCALVVSCSDYIMRPILESADDVLSTIPMMIGAIGGVIAFGLSGLILGPLTLATMLFLLEEYRNEITEPQAPDTPAAP